jgi:hypothetical protein
MAHPKPPPESPDKGEGNDPSPMDRFKRMTRDLSRVEPEAVREAERREREERKRLS